MEKRIQKHPLHSAPTDERAYWLSRPVEERIAEVERLREEFYGDAIQQRLQRIVTKRPLK